MKRWISMLLAIILVLSIPPIPAHAHNSAYTPDDYGGIISSGECGAEGGNVTWTLYDSGLLVISGAGAMSSDVISAWSDHIDLITRIVIEHGVTTIGDYAFVDCYNMTEVTIPGSINAIGREAFYACESLTTVNIPEGVTSIGEDAFAECYGLTSVTIPVSVSVIRDGAFYSCYYLEDVYYGGTEEQWAQIEIGDWNDVFSFATIHYGHSPEPAVAYGDVNADGKINTLDLIVLRQYLAGWDLELEESAADVNADGKANTLDLIILRQYLAGLDVTLGPMET